MASNPLNVIALISGGKDSLFSILHCIHQGHKVVALANLYPQPRSLNSPRRAGTAATAADADTIDQDITTTAAAADTPDDIDSYMYQTVGHEIIPFYQEALEISLYRQAITGRASNTDKSYSYRQPSSDTGGNSDEDDETESLIPLLQRVLLDHRTANAVCTGAILSSYQRTRVESVCLRLGLVPLAPLWQYPILPPHTQTSLLEQMDTVGMEARIIKVASGGLTERHLWRDVTDNDTMRMLERSMGQFSDTLGSGEILGEGGEFETIALNGPWPIWKKKIRIDDSDRLLIRGEGGSCAVKIKHARWQEKTGSEMEYEQNWSERLTIPPLLDDEFLELSENRPQAEVKESPRWDAQKDEEGKASSSSSSSSADGREIRLVETAEQSRDKLSISNVSAPSQDFTVEEQISTITADLRKKLAAGGLEPDDIVFTTILLKRMSDFATVNKIYSKLFEKPNPPARVTVSCGDMMPPDTAVMLSAFAEKRESSRMRGLHVQSRSYWAPANIGPYSQAISSPLHHATELEQEESNEVVYVAGQIPLVPSTMELWDASFLQQATLSLQHLWRIGRKMGVNWWAGSIAFIPTCPGNTAGHRAEVAGLVWKLAHRLNVQNTDIDEDSEDEDIAEKSLRSPWSISRPVSHNLKIHTPRAHLPDRNMIQHQSVKPDSALKETYPPCFIAEVSELPRSAPIEWYGVGLRGNVVLSDENSSDGHLFDTYTCYVKDTNYATKTLAISADKLRDQHDWQMLILKMKRDTENAGIRRCEVFTSKIPPLEIQQNLQAAWIPCKSIRNSTGKALGAVIRLETH